MKIGVGLNKNNFRGGGFIRGGGLIREEDHL